MVTGRFGTGRENWRNSMNKIEIIFFENYKKLDNLCKDILNSNQGVSDYINEMNNTPLGKRMLVQTWEDDFKNLKHIRWVRNDIAHGNGESECEQDDIDFVINFYQRIMNQTDPFGIIHKKESIKNVAPKKTVRQVNREPVNTLYNYPTDQNGDSKDSSVLKWVLAIIIAGVFFCVYIFTN